MTAAKTTTTPANTKQQVPSAGWRWRCESEEEMLGVLATLQAAQIDAWPVVSAQGWAVESSDPQRASELWHRLAQRLAMQNEQQQRGRLRRRAFWTQRGAWASLLLAGSAVLGFALCR